MRKPAESFRDLEFWRKAHAFVLDVYGLTRAFPDEERFGLSSQFRRAAVSIPANIAEGFRKYSAADKARLLNVAEGSLEECRYYCLLTEDLGYGTTRAMQESLSDIAKQMSAYLLTLRKS